ncbi:DUF1127 domain-containing protein [Telmatospirillum siberiense]|uniref:DUF1127 domain-containing protein n=1 Tax=Telmatospirillum siberiense TaxID=382514 RepID=A0A2N3PSD0_9PROT|nr:DUF1127 domain-containing protein [Telmatospirillum siberiense]PKU23308.1 DUF1127 domain-containing protein [Telmatospirillum siberiense]
MPKQLLSWMKSGDRLLLRTWARVEAALARRRERRRLLGLDDHLLKDIGLSRCDAHREAGKGWH